MSIEDIDRAITREEIHRARDEASQTTDLLRQPRPCEGCGITYRPLIASQRFHSRECRLKRLPVKRPEEELAAPGGDAATVTGEPRPAEPCDSTGTGQVPGPYRSGAWEPGGGLAIVAANAARTRRSSDEALLAAREARARVVGLVADLIDLPGVTVAVTMRADGFQVVVELGGAAA